MTTQTIVKNIRFSAKYLPLEKLPERSPHSPESLTYTEIEEGDMIVVRSVVDGDDRYPWIGKPLKVTTLYTVDGTVGIEYTVGEKTTHAEVDATVMGLSPIKNRSGFYAWGAHYTERHTA